MKYKKILFHLLIALAVLFSADFIYQSVEQTHQPHAAANHYSKNQYTWWAFKHRAQVSKPVSNKWDNARDWYYNARKSKYATSRTPRKFAIMQSTAGYYGHVAVVEQVYKSDGIKISEYNFYRPLKYNTRILSKKATRNFNYIYQSKNFYHERFKFLCAYDRGFLFFVHINLFRRYDGLT